ncbi:MAG: endolytic transglycosylase MltG [Flavobacteriaceae bacterium CG_4_8_14_3_um_filter_34_10]|nr:MAG: aminodeoxychorismate lyase [Flavobacteriaceae bacterium CG2_30_34_30]PIQ17115.1 MAG: aminodeoxychorismate lyase [Flavobacteriaceae bacterium CG18_big_fil_WC_8_21_14_2_50_34_36]PIX10282.1 MAG: endolytic transglycosylase MltG [Flavobacteriaceae bacterium CG_4_8_14_3_um_filter_34_10]PIZ07962.1 MAG: endolytic transglycosylase MltG [Flavobacteriaceae bacterium CG_4_10_14_0_8_um_filter_34_31]PJC06276.1 MAG: endolytic transglycosylase MltG [Flavobacteriaceae bacterium CG_4_9_14_0_8_um_filter_3
MYIKKILLAVVLIGLVIASIFSYYIYNTIFSPNTAFEEDTVFIYVPSDRSYAAVRNQLKDLLKDPESFDIVAQKKGYISNVKPGRYQLRKEMNNNAIINTLRSNNLPLKISFNNQETLDKLAGRIAEQIEADSISLLKAMVDSDFLKENGFNEENALGMYIPNSYEFYWNSSAETFRDKMHTEYNRFWNKNRLAKAEALKMTPQQIISLAAIVQKETARVDERPRVAGVYVNRLRVGMLLQADPTVIFAVKKLTGVYDTIIKRVLYKDLETDSPYNTYKYAGVPPGPIAMPDISSIDAVLNYEKHDYFYFVANVENPGYHLFAKNLAQHNRNRQQYVQWMNKKGVNR